MDSILYKLISRMGILANNGVHPKRDIIQYEKWFLSKLEKDEHVLEVGSHRGEMSVHMASKVSLVIAVELIEELHQYSKTHNFRDNIEYILSDATKHDFSNYKISTIVLSNVLEHIEDRENFLKNLTNQINWKGEPRFLIRVPMITRDWVSPFKKSLGVDYFLDPTHYIEYTSKELHDEIERSGLCITHLETMFGESYLECCKKQIQL